MHAMRTLAAALSASLLLAAARSPVARIAFAWTPGQIELPAIALLAAAQSSSLEKQSVAAFLRELNRAVTQDDRPAVSGLVRYPLVVWAGDVRILLPDPAALVQQYDAVFSPALKAVIADATALPRGGDALPGSVVVSRDVVTIANDAVRIEPVAGALKITRLSVPLASVTATSASPVPAGPGGRASPRVNRQPVRILMGIGRIERAGALEPGGRDSYVVSAVKNRLLDVRVTRVNGRDVVVRISNAKSRAAVDSRAHEGVRTWTGRLPEDGDYLIEIVRLAPASAGRLPYGVVISMR
jgi:hypothetical protein